MQQEIIVKMKEMYTSKKTKNPILSPLNLQLNRASIATTSLKSKNLKNKFN